MAKYYVGIDVGGTKIAYGLFDASFQLLSRLQMPSKPALPAEAAIDEIIEQVGLLLQSAGKSKEEVSGVGVCVPSFVSEEKGEIIYTANLPTWVGVPIRSLMSEKLGLPVEIDNDANAAAIAEHRMGAGQGQKNMIYITISTGVGGGLIINNHIFRGSHGMAGEIGHMLVSDQYGFACGCGNAGCVESISSGQNMARYAAEKIAQGVESSIVQYAAGAEINTKHIALALAENDPLAIETVDHAAEYLARLFVSLYQILDIDHVVYGGGAVKVGARLMERCEARFKEMCKYAKDFPVTFVPAMLGDDTGIIGAALLADEELD